MVTRSPSQLERTIVRVRNGIVKEEPDVLAVEEPLEIRLLWQDGRELRRRNIAVTMRTPGHDFELATGFLFGEGIIREREDVADVSYCLDDEEQAFNIVNLTLRPGLEFDITRLERNFYTTSSCGVCGKAALDALEVQGCSVLASTMRVPAGVICGLPQRLRESQAVFDRTGGLHAAGLFTRDGEFIASQEDVGRHNAVDKLIGGQFLDGRTPLDDCVLMLSGRSSFELVQKSLVARIPIVASVGAPSSLAVQLAESFGMTLAGFVRHDGFNLYTGASRVIS